jgi:polyhydroxybutyrate depolymerase
MVYPNANGKYWNLTGGGTQGNDDVEFVSSLLDQLENVLCIDQHRVYAAGVSNGGGFVSRLGCELSDRLTGIASVAGLYGREPACPPSRPLSVLEMHGTADTTVPYGGLPTRAIASVDSFLLKWERWDSCPSGAPSYERLGPGALLQSKTGCAKHTQVLHIRLHGEPHAWPADNSGSPVKFDGATAIMQFFARGVVLPQARAAHR